MHPFLKGVESVYMAYASAIYYENILMVAYPKEADGGLFAVLTPFSNQVFLLIGHLSFFADVMFQ